MGVRLIVIGKPTREYSQVIQEYEKRLPKYCRFEVLQLKDDKGFLDKVKGKFVLLDRLGQLITSEGLADVLKTQDITFGIGGDTGFSEAIKSKANLSLAFSKMTFPHQLARLMLTEQIYRAFTILKGEKYHK